MNSVFCLINANVLTMNPDDPRAEAVLVDGKAIAAVGTTGEISTLCEERGGEVIDLQGQTLLPGFHDCHVHMMGTGLNSFGIDMYDAKSVGEVLERVKEAAARYPKDRWIFGKRLDESRLAEGRPPTLAELDEVAPEHPVYVVDRGWHYTLTNSVGMDLLGVEEEMPGVRKDGEGRPTGRLHEEANRQAKMAFFELQSPEHRKEALRRVADMAASRGVTSIQAVEGGELFSNTDIPILMEVEDELKTRVVLWWSTEDVEKVARAGLPRVGEDILLDGSIGSRTAAFEEPYDDDPGNTGDLYYSDEEVEEMVRQAHLNDLQISFHAIGERAITQAIDAFEKVLAEHPKADHRHRLDHCGFPKDEDIERAARLGLVISTQPTFMYLRAGPGKVYNRRLGEERARGGYPLRAFLDAGIIVGAGSDSDVTPLDPLLGIHAAVHQPYPESDVTVEEALRMYTLDAARIVFDEERTGSIEVGKLADLVVLGRDPLTAPKDSLKDLPVTLTVKGGEVTYKREEDV